MLVNTRNRNNNISRVTVGVSQESIIAGVRSLCIKRYGDASPANLHKLFLDFDKNGDGCLGGNELNTLLATIDQCTVIGCSVVSNKIIGALDKDGNRCITWEEYAAAAGIPVSNAAGLKETSEPPVVAPVVPKGRFDEFKKGVNVASKLGDQPKPTEVKPVAKPPVTKPSSSGGGGGMLVLGIGAIVGVVLLAR